MQHGAERLYLPGGASGSPPPLLEGAIRYVALEPCAALRPFVEQIGLAEERVAPGAVVEERVIPDGAVHLIFNLGDPPSAGGGSGFAAEVAGASCTAALLRMAGTLDGISVQLRAGGAAAILGLPAGEFAGRTLPLADLWGARAAEVLERLAGTRGARERIAVVEGALREALDRSGEGAHRTAARTVRRIHETGGRIPVRELAAGAGVGERRLEQLFHRHVGLSPKAVARLARFHACVRLLRERPGLSWTRAALECGYYDQAHLANEVRRITGLTPTELRRRIASDSSKTEPPRAATLDPSTE